MKKMLITALLPCMLAMTMFRSCEDRTYRTFTANVPIYLSYDSLRAGVSVEASRDLNQPGAIYFKDQYMYINEYRSGIHIYDLTDPAQPDEVSFIEIPGNISMAIKGNTLYADSYIDLVAIDISDPENPSESGRLKDLFSYTIPDYNYDYPVDEIDKTQGVITGWEIKEIKRQVYPNYYPWPIYYDYAEMTDSRWLGAASTSSVASGEYGIAGSMATFLTYDFYLYVLENRSTLKTIDISTLISPELKNEQYISWDLETMFIADGYMYIGASSGMHILSLNNPSNPAKKSTYQHFTSCDPVVVSGNYAYITLRAGNFCGGTANELDVVNIADKNNPYLLAAYDMQEPYGLGIDGNNLFVCEGEFGMKVYDATDKFNIDDNRLATFPDFQAKDLILAGDLLFLIGDDGFRIYDKSDMNNITLQGTIPVVAAAE